MYVFMCYYNIVLDIKYILLPKKVRFLNETSKATTKNHKEYERS